MTALPVAHYLKELVSGSERSRSSRALAGLAPGSAKAAEAAAREDEAHARGLAEGHAAARTEFEARLEQHIAAAAETLAAERKKWTAEQSERLASHIVTAFGALETTIADQVGRVLKPVLLKEVQARAVADLLEALRALLAKGEFAKLVVSGPEDLLAGLRQNFDGKVANVSFVPAAGCELRIAADETILETRIEAWAEAIQGAGP